MIFFDYEISEECKNPDAWYICHKCGECGRVFGADGIMEDDGGTHVAEEDDG